MADIAIRADHFPSELSGGEQQRAAAQGTLRAGGLAAILTSPR